MALVLVSLVSLSALWAFAASLTLGDGLNLRKVDTVHDHFGYPSGALGSALQAERRLAAVYLGSGLPGDQAALESGRLVTDRQADLFRRLTADEGAQDAASQQARGLAARIVQQLDALGTTRTAVDRKSMTRSQSFTNYTAVITDLGTLQGSLSTLSNADVARDARNQVSLTRAREMLAQEDALLAGVLAAGRMTPAERAEFSRLVGAQRTLYGLAAPELATAERAYLQRITGMPEYTRLRTLEDRFAGQARRTTEAETAVLWKTTADSNLTRLRGLELALADASERRAEPIANGIMARLVIAGALGAVAVVVSIVLAIWVARSVIRDLSGLRREALDLADVRLPRVIGRLRRGEEVDVAAEAPPLSFGTAEIDQVGQAFNAARRTAIQGAVEEATLRRSINDVFVNLARRSQALLHRQLGLLDAMERRINDPEDLEDLFRVDHLAARMRRHAEGLIILSGQAPGRAWRNPVAVMDVARAAASEVEDYTRVNVAPMSRAAVAGIAVADVVHLLAELIENAAIFSPPHTTVQVTGQQAARGFIIEIDDRGLGMTPEALAAANERLASPGEFDLSDTAQLGLFVVGRLARRHNVKVSLRISPYGGTTAIVLLPLDIVTPGDDERLDSGPAALTRRAEDARIPVGAVRDFRHDSGSGQFPAIESGGGGAVLRLPVGDDTGGFPVVDGGGARRADTGGFPAVSGGSSPRTGTGGFPVVDGRGAPRAGSGGHPNAGGGHRAPVGHPATDAGGYPATDAGGYPATDAGGHQGAAGGYQGAGAGGYQDAGGGGYPGAGDTGGFPRADAENPPGEAFARADTGPFPRVDTGGFPRADTGGFPVADTGGIPRVDAAGTPQAPPPTGPPVTSVPPPVFDELSPMPAAPPVPPESVVPPDVTGERPELPVRRKAPGGASRPDLPRRVAQANLAPQLRRDRGAGAGEPAAAPAPPRSERSPEELRSMMSSIQRGTRRGRAEGVEDGGGS
ncbi:nitrate- and nitrite sensing domain-containing protein [Spirillospora sp. NPDC047279]|uniref:sensor histidine kinase n=1 Tax=Spirillospora sp. NPDC047279 TaxID=3155478 RepID=UPI00340A33B7